MEQDLDPYLLRAFLASAETGTISAAAERLSRTQAAVSMQVQRLETDLGTKLLDRTSRGVSLTSTGEMLAAYAKRLLALGKEARQQVGGRRMEGRIRLGLVEDLSLTRLPALLAEFLQSFPAVKLELTTAQSPDLSTAIEDGRCDIVIADPSRFGSGPYFHWSRQLVWAASRLIDVVENEPVPLIAFNGSCTWQDRTSIAFAQAGIAWTARCYVATFAALLAALRAGLGFTLILPETLPADCEMVDTRYRLPPAQNADFGLFLTHNPAQITTELAAFLRTKMEI